MSEQSVQIKVSWSLIGLVVLVLGVVLLVIIVRQPSGPPQLSQRFDDSDAIHFSYPADWIYQIPAQGVIIAGPEATLNSSSPGPALTIQRMYPVSVYGSIEGALQEYLSKGPMQAGANWEITEAVAPTTFQEQPAVAVELRGIDGPQNTSMYLRALATAAENSFVYLFLLTVPTDSQARDLPTLEAMLASVEIRE